MSRRTRSLVLIGLGTAIVAVGVLFWLFDVVGAGDRVGRGVEVAGIDAAGMTEDELRDALTDLAPGYGATDVRLIDADDEVIVETTARGLGIGLDVEATVDEALAHQTPASPWGWVGSFFSTTEVAAVLTIDEDAARQGVEALDMDESEPVEPNFVVDTGRIVVDPGQPGTRLDVGTTVAALAEAVGDDPIEVPIPTEELAPSISDEEAEALAAEANSVTAGGIVVRAGEVERTLDSAALRAWLLLEAAEGSEDQAVLGIDEEMALAGLRFALGTVGGNQDQQATFRIAFGQVFVEDPEPVLVCCSEEAPADLLAALVAGAESVSLEPVEQPSERDAAWAEALGIEEMISEFTTAFTAGQSRVVNIARIAELTQGVVIEPGDTFS
ncbi:MAG: peptidoglycan binding domain-containing protein, partial [Acidimicrobiia bacterium]|nr:peptidoglycan binding domain-containing protein [Acidimicrobiia bacterium]